MSTAIFHLAFPISDIDQAKAFYVDGLGCELGRESPGALILNFYDHQIVAHLTQDPLPPQGGIYPRHFGLVFTKESDWEALVDRAERQNLTFYHPPRRRFPGEILEHRTVFLADPFNNLLEFKYYCHPKAIFGCQDVGQIGDRSGT